MHDGPALVTELTTIRRDPAPFDPGRIEVPVVVAWGSESLERHQRGSEWLADSVPGATKHVIEGAGHNAHRTHLRQVVELVLSAVRRAGSEPAETMPPREDRRHGRHRLHRKRLGQSAAGAGDEVHPIVRRPPGLGEIGIDPTAVKHLDTSHLAGRSLEGLDAAVHLAGAPIIGRWSARRLENIRSSRVAVGDILARALACLHRPPAVLVSGSAVGIYGDRGEEVLDESSPQGSGLLADLCRSWEACAAPVAEVGIWVVTIRTGIVLGGKVAPGRDTSRRSSRCSSSASELVSGNGRQWTSWVSLDDEIAIMLRAIDDGELSGPVTRTAPNPVRNADLTDAIAQSIGRRAGSRCRRRCFASARPRCRR